MKKQVVVVGAVVVRDGLVFCTQRGGLGSLAGLWEFPGGKIEPGESPEEALEREVREELECQVEVGELVTTTTHEYEFAVVTLSTYYCSLVGGEPRLTEHSDAKWLSTTELSALEWAPADIPAVQVIQANSSLNAH